MVARRPASGKSTCFRLIKMLTESQAYDLANKILSYSKLPECQIFLWESEEAYVRFANNAITTSGFVERRTIAIQSTRDRKTGAVSLTEIDEPSLRAAVARSEEMASLASVNQEYVEPLGPQEYPKLNKFHEETAKARSPVMIPHIRAIIDGALEAKLNGAGFFTRSSGVSAVANKRGLFGFHASTNASLSTTVRKPDGTSSGWASQPSPRISDIDGAALAERAITKCLKWEKPKRLEPGKYAVVLEPAATADLVGFLTSNFSARDADEGRSFLAKKGGGTYLGEKLFPEIITLRSDPFEPRLSSNPWSGDLLPNQRVTWIEKGVVKNLAYGRYWAAKKNKHPVPEGDSGVLEGGSGSIDDLIRTTERGLLVTRFWYIREVNPQTLQLTGLTRDTIFLIENGKVTTPVMNFRFNESPVRLLQNVQQLGQPVPAEGAETSPTLAPPLRATEFTFTSISDAV